MSLNMHLDRHCFCSDCLVHVAHGTHSFCPFQLIQHGACSECILCAQLLRLSLTGGANTSSCPTTKSQQQQRPQQIKQKQTNKQTNKHTHKKKKEKKKAKSKKTRNSQQETTLHHRMMRSRRNGTLSCTTSYFDMDVREVQYSSKKKPNPPHKGQSKQTDYTPKHNITHSTPPPRTTHLDAKGVKRSARVDL